MSQNELQGSILFVDDELSILNVLKRIFIPLHFTIHTASNAQEGLHILASHPIDVVVSDMRMPEMDGVTFLKQVADQWPHTTRLLLTGYADIQDAIAAINEGGIEHYISKPWKNDHLIKIVTDIFEKKSLIEKNSELQTLLMKQNEELKANQLTLEKKVNERTEELQILLKNLKINYESTRELLLSIVELNERLLKGHCRRIEEHCKKIALLLNLSENDTVTLCMAAMLHKLGKIGLAHELQYKPIQTLSEKEMIAFKQYPQLSAALLTSFPAFKDIVDCISSHREHYDGSGFPNKISGSRIPLTARILAFVVDFHELQDGLVFPITLKPALSFAYLKDHAHYYDPDVFTAFSTIFLESYAQEDKAALRGPKERLLMPNQLKSGMILSRDLVSKHGFTLATQNSICSSDFIHSIKFMEDIVVYIKDGP